MVVSINIFLALPFKLPNPIGAGRLLRVEILRARDFNIFKKVCMSSGRNRRGEVGDNVFYRLF